MSDRKLAPVALFVFNRPEHAKITIEALLDNHLASKTDLIVFSDGYKKKSDEQKVIDVRKYVRSLKGFKAIFLVERENNWGLAESIIDGVTSVVNKYGKVIVLEDDIVTSQYFLGFMNAALDAYANNEKVWHISGWGYPIDFETREKYFFWRVMNCWGWATWSNRWDKFERNPERLIREWNHSKKYAFDLDGSKVFWPQVIANEKNKINTWAIFWYATIFDNNGLCLNPHISYVDNIGHDDTGTHCGSSDMLVYKNSVLSYDVPDFNVVDVKESELAVRKIKTYYQARKKSFSRRVVNKISRILLGKNIFE